MPGRISTILRRRERVARMYNRLFSSVRGIRVPYVAPGVRVSWFVYVLRLAPDYTRRDRDRILAGLRARGVECSDYFRPIHLQPCYQQEWGFRRGDFPVAESVGNRTIALPFHGRLTQIEIERVVRTLKELL
jgi:perosamine synthetase